MATLSEAADVSRKGLRWIMLAGIAIIGLLFVLFLGQAIKNQLFPSKPTPPTVAFGKIPKLDLSEGIKPPAGIDYSIETISGQLPNIATSSKVFLIAQEESSFGALERVTATV